ncbi:Flagellar biosynthesis protein, FliO [compost metagenome]
MALPAANELNTGTSNPLETSGLTIWGNLITVIVVLAIIIVLIILLVRFMAKKNRISSYNRAIQTMGAVGLGPNKSLQVVQIGGSLYLVGVGENITLLDKISDPSEVAVLQQALEEESPEFPALTSVVSSLVSRFKKKEEVIKEEELESTPFHEVFQTQIQKIPNRKQQIQELLRDSEIETTDRSRDS